MRFQSYYDADCFLGRKQDRPLPGRSTRIQRREENGIAIRYHNTDVVTLYPDHIMIDTGGWRTVTTKARINEYAPIHVWQTNFKWHFQAAVEVGGPFQRDFVDGMIISWSGIPYVNTNPKRDWNAVMHADELPKAPYYVLCDDSFMSGWGYAKNKTNTIILPCDNMTEAMQVEAHAKARQDQKHIRIVTQVTLDFSTHFYSLAEKRRYPTWYGLKDQ